MSSEMKAVFDALLPPGAIWRPKPGGDFEKLLEGAGENAQEMYSFLSDLANIRNPRKTPILSDLEKEYGIITNELLTDAERIAALVAQKYAIPNTASDEHLQDRLRNAGFTGIIVTPNDPAVDPDLVPGELLVTTPLYETQDPGYLAQAGGDNTYAGNALAVAGYYLSIERDPVVYSIPDDWRYWRYFYWVGGAASGWPGSPAVATFDVDWKRESDLKRLVLAYKPLGTWAVLVVKYKQYWTAQTAAGSFAGVFQRGAYGDGLYLLVGTSGEIQTSPDGETWTARSAAGGYTGTFAAAAYGNGLFVIGGTNGEIQTSPDGENWTARSAAGGYTGGFTDATFDGTRFILVGTGGEIQTSLDGITWTAQAPDGGFTGDFFAATYGNGQIVIAGASGEIQTSVDGSTWTAQAAAGSYAGTFTGAAFGNGTFVLVGTSAEIQSSLDGEVWTARTPAGSFTGSFATAIHGNGIFVIAGSSGEIERSFDGKAWKQEDPDGGFSGFFAASIFGNRLFILAGQNGEIQTS